MGRNIKNIVRKYRLLPGFLQERAFFDFYTKTRKELGEVEALVFAEEMFEATKTKYKPKLFNRFNMDSDYKRKQLIDTLSTEEQKEFFKECKDEELIQFLNLIRSVEIKEEIFPRIINYINTSSRPNSTIESLALHIAPEDDSSYLLKYKDEIFQLAMQFDEDAYRTENQESPNLDMYDHTTICNLTKNIFQHLSQEQKSVLCPKLIDYYLKHRRHNGIYNSLKHEMSQIVRDLPEEIQ